MNDCANERTSRDIMQISYRLVGGGAVFILVVRLVPVRSVGRLVGHTWNMNYNNNLWKWWNIPHTTAILVRPICQCHGTFPVAIVSTEWNERKISIRMVMDKFVTMTKLLRGRTISSEPKKVHREHREEKRNHFVREEIECSLCAWIYYMLLSYRFRFCIFMEVFFPFLSVFFSQFATFSSMPLNNGCDEIWMRKRFLFAHAHRKIVYFVQQNRMRFVKCSSVNIFAS